jgi:hypothetical protein
MASIWTSRARMLHQRLLRWGWRRVCVLVAGIITGTHFLAQVWLDVKKSFGTVRTPNADVLHRDGCAASTLLFFFLVSMLQIPLSGPHLGAPALVLQSQTTPTTLLAPLPPPNSAPSGPFNCPQLLLGLAERAELKQKVADMFEGKHINSTEDRAVLHVALRAPRDAVSRGALGHCF